jgi:undecaprenyl-diphosphatase
MLQSFDLATSRAVLDAFGGSKGFDWAMRLLIEVDLLRMGPLVALLLFVWVVPNGRADARPEIVLRSMAGIFVATFLSRILQNSLPAQPRPRLGAEDLPFPDLGHLTFLSDWSSFPSDTATLVFAIVAAIWMVSWRLAVVAAIWGTLLACFPRLYLGYHYLSDLLAGALLGTLAMAAVQWPPLLRRPASLARRWTERYPAIALVMLLILGYELLSSFRSVMQMRDALRETMDALLAWGARRELRV